MTHAQYPSEDGLKAWINYNQAIEHIPDGCADHDIDRASLRQGPAESGNKLAKCITTSGGGMKHPSGRNLTIREFACLQGFPLEHKFAEMGVTSKIHQIGNAVPSSVSKILLEEIKKALLKADGL